MSAIHVYKHTKLCSLTMRRASFWVAFLCLVSGASALKFSFREVQKIPCPHTNNVRTFLHNDKLQRGITTHWTKTHKITDWSSSRSKVVTTPGAYEEIERYGIPTHSTKGKGLFRMHTTYESYVHIPKILKTIMKTKIKTKTAKTSYVIDNREYKVVHITDIPLINFIRIYSKSVFTADGSVFTSHSVETGDIPFWALWSQHLIQNIIRDSATDFQRQITIDMCKPY